MTSIAVIIHYSNGMYPWFGTILGKLYFFSTGNLSSINLIKKINNDLFC